MKPMRSEILEDMLTAKNTPASLRETAAKKEGVRLQMERLKKDPDAFLKDLRAEEKDYMDRLERWNKQEREDKRRQREEQTADAKKEAPKKKREADQGTQRALELCRRMLKAIKEKTK